MPPPAFPSRNPDYPPELQHAEESAIRDRRSGSGTALDAPVVGLALSGGGIRSATFCLGLFQALARQKLVRRADYLSTVSGGGYFGSFLGTAFSRENGSPDKVERDLADNHSWCVCWLRENGRFLSPNGSGDDWLTAAIALRNWLTLHTVILTFAYLIISFGSLIRAELSKLEAWHQLEVTFWNRYVEFWWSPWIILPAIPVALVMVPTALIYWSTQLSPLVAVARLFIGVFRPSARAMSNPEFATRAQLLLTRGFMVGLASAVGLLIFALLDSIGQTAYRHWAENDFAFPALWAGLTGVGVGLYGLASRVVLYLERFLRRKRIRVTFDVIALGLALVWLALILCGLSVVACGFVWQWRPVQETIPGVQDIAITVAAAFLMSWVFSRNFGFVNLSSMQQMYAARLARAYLGATNPIRQQHANHNMTDLIPGDEVPIDAYAPQRHGGPLHLINVTVNETISGRTQIQRRDRKGLPMAMGPSGLSVGTQAHALWAPPDAQAKPASMMQALWETRTRVMIPLVAAEPAGRDGQSGVPWSGTSFDPRATEHPRMEALSLGRWVAISGAAFTTGTGANTSLGLSLLLGLANVRLGYWWNSGITPHRSKLSETKANLIELGSRIVARILPVQSCLLNEFFARFHGPARRHWYLSDGGHFENTACYELIRRRVPFIICSDAGQDPGYRFDDLANLIRKARTDFGAEIQIVRRAGDSKDDPNPDYPMPSLQELVHPNLLDVIGTPEDFSPLVESTDDDTPPPRADSRRHALLARIHYLDTNTFCWLLMIKPSLMGDETLDVVQYQRTHPLFPQEPTSDQYFDEAQWESYRKLGEHIGAELFTPPVGTVPNSGGTWSPSQMRPPEAPKRTALEDLANLAARLASGRQTQDS